MSTVHRYTGKLEIHSEMCCGWWLQFHDNRGLYGDKNQYWNWDYTLNFAKGSNYKNIKVEKDGKILYEGPLTCKKRRTEWELQIPDQLKNARELLGWSGADAVIDTEEVLKAFQTIEKEQ